MRAITQQALGGPEVLELVEVERPHPGAGEVLVRVAATSVNAADWKLRTGEVDKLGPPPFTLGFDVSGTVAETGSGVTDFGIGDEVYGMVLSRSGAYAEYVVVPADYLAPKPASIDHSQAAALPTAVLTAWHALTKIAPGQRVLVHAAAGGVGHLAVQIAKLHGAYVIGTARSDNHEFLRSLGVDEVIDYRTTDFTTVTPPVDVVFDLVGGEYGERSLSILTPDGRLIDAQRDDALDDPRFHRTYVAPSGADLREIATLVDRGLLRVEVASVMPFADVARAHRLSESGRVRGKIVLVP
ncbi:zinc-binding dehydrogenase [Nocardia sp. SYP-A9097]|uniref:NADP-dependent oxidoreductase n=1 Tax=Nocardia sp. SYP-A9097 TaxID=2663237 RepID=UPI00129A0FDC|nr:NADP-dependent oxidoreductase [Nocardia sp. SYP-A9097]MRH86420.1 zinc-binding dehydrogenase [Nocardia sp. SYP-A9097]